jgi:hypothetical protein
MVCLVKLKNNMVWKKKEPEPLKSETHTFFYPEPEPHKFMRLLNTVYNSTEHNTIEPKEEADFT